MDADAAKKKRKRDRMKKTGTAEDAEQADLESDSSMSMSSKTTENSHTDLMEKARLRHEQKCRDELSQPYIFRDRNLWIAENCLLYLNFYDKVMHSLSKMGLAIKMTLEVIQHSEINFNYAYESYPMMVPSDKKLVRNQFEKQHSSIINHAFH